MGRSGRRYRLPSGRDFRALRPRLGTAASRGPTVWRAGGTLLEQRTLAPSRARRTTSDARVSASSALGPLGRRYVVRVCSGGALVHPPRLRASTSVRCLDTRMGTGGLWYSNWLGQVHF